MVAEVREKSQVTLTMGVLKVFPVGTRKKLGLLGFLP